jgi:hypothetical protein
VRIDTRVHLSFIALPSLPFAGIPLCCTVLYCILLCCSSVLCCTVLHRPYTLSTTAGNAERQSFVGQHNARQRAYFSSLSGSADSAVPCVCAWNGVAVFFKYVAMVTYLFRSYFCVVHSHIFWSCRHSCTSICTPFNPTDSVAHCSREQAWQ